MNNEKFPLQWPAAYPRSKSRDRARFKTTFWQAVKRLYRELELMGAGDIVVSTNVPLRRDGLPYADPPRINDPGVAIYFKLKSQTMSMACDAWDKVDDNAQALCLTIEAMRGLDRWGSSDMLNRVFQGFTALPAPASSRPWWEILGARDAQRPIDEYETRYKQQMRLAHPDAGGSNERAQELNQAIQEARSARRTM